MCICLQEAHTHIHLNTYTPIHTKIQYEKKEKN